MTEALSNSINSPTATLTTGIGNATATLPVTAPASPDTWPTGGDFRILIDGELIVVTAASPSATSLAVVARGAEATIAASHALGAAVDIVLTRVGLLNTVNQLITNPVLNVKDFGAIGDGSTNDTTAIQNTINALDVAGNDRGGAVWFPRGVYSVSGLTYAHAAPPRFMSEVSSMGNITGTTGATLVPRANGQTILTIGDGSTLYQEGAYFEYINFWANGFTGCTGLKLNAVNNWKGQACGFKDLAIGIEQRAGVSTDNAWNTLDSCRFVGCTTAGIKMYDAFGLVIIGGCMLVPDGTGGTAYGIWATGGAGEATQSIKSIGLFMDGMNHPGSGSCIGVFFERAHECLLDGMKFEQLDIGVLLDQADAADSGAGAANAIVNCTGTGSSGDTFIKINTNASDVHIFNPSCSSLTTGINNAGKRTKVFGGHLDVTTPWTGTRPEFFGTTMPDVGSGRYSETVLGSGSSADTLGFFGTAGSTKATITGSRGGNAALASLLTQLAAKGIITDGSS